MTTTIEQSLLAFTLAAALVTVTPGLDTALVLRAAAAQGRRAALLAGAGICLGCLAWGTIVAVGLGALLVASQLAYAALKIVGAAYLLYLGVTLLLPRAKAESEAADTRIDAGTRWLQRGLLTNLLNPKVGIFYTAFLPQFVPLGVSVMGFSWLLALIHAGLGLLWFLLLAQAAAPAGRFFRQKTVSAWLDRALGGLLLLLGARLLASLRD